MSHLCWVNLHDHLLATQEWVADELARSKRDWLLAVGHFDYVGSEDCLEGETDVELSLGHWRWIGFGGQKFVVAKAGYSKLVARVSVGWPIGSLTEPLKVASPALGR